MGIFTAIGIAAVGFVVLVVIVWIVLSVLAKNMGGW